MNILFIFNDPPYGSERTYNGLRLATALARRAGNEVRAFLMGDSVLAAHANQTVPSGFYNVEAMLGNIARHGGLVGLCGTCLDARGISPEELMQGTRRGTLEELADWTAWAGQVLVF